MAEVQLVRRSELCEPRLVLGGVASTLLTAALSATGLLGKVAVKVMQLMSILALGFNYVGFYASLMCNKVSSG